MTLQNRINAFAKLGEFLNQFSENEVKKNENVLYNDLFFDSFSMQIKRGIETNGWFTDKNILFALDTWSNELNINKLNNWVSNYDLTSTKALNIGIIMAGNIPLVGFHDFISVLISGNKAIVKQSSNDIKLLPLIAKYLEKVESGFKGKIQFIEGKLENIDAIIATGSNNTAKYFEYYFGKYPNIVRRNRNSAAIITGAETSEELEKLGEDIFRYFGLGCRSVSKLFVPKNYDFDKLFKAIYTYNPIIDYSKYENNYDYNKAVYLMSQFQLLENGFLMLKEDNSYASPIATLFYEYYDDIDGLKKKLESDRDSIQCIVGNQNIKGIVPFGETQKPKLWDYADDVDTLDFLQKLKQ